MIVYGDVCDDLCGVCFVVNLWLKIIYLKNVR